MKTIIEPEEAKEEDSQEPSLPTQPKGWLKKTEETLTSLKTIVVLTIGLITLPLTFFHENIEKYFQSTKPVTETPLAPSAKPSVNEAVIIPKPEPLPKPAENKKPASKPKPKPKPNAVLSSAYNEQQNATYTVLILSSDELKNWVERELKPALEKHHFTVKWQDLPQHEGHLYYYSNEASLTAKHLSHLHPRLKKLLPELGGNLPKRKNEIQLHIN